MALVQLELIGTPRTNPMSTTSFNMPLARDTPSSSTTALAVVHQKSKSQVPVLLTTKTLIECRYRVSGYSSSIFTAIAVLKRLAKFVKDGKYTGDIGRPVKTAVMGFSFGSYTTHGAIATMPDLADAVILTAIGFNTTGLNANGLVRSFEPRVANQQNPVLYGNLDNGYLTWADKFGLIWK
jgi:hypothetical protein